MAQVLNSAYTLKPRHRQLDPLWFKSEIDKSLSQLFSKIPGSHLEKNFKPQIEKRMYNMFYNNVLMDVERDLFGDGCKNNDSALRSGFVTSEEEVDVHDWEIREMAERNALSVIYDDLSLSDASAPSLDHPLSPEEKEDSKEEKKISITCRYWAAGKCARSDCPFMHCYQNGQKKKPAKQQKKSRK